MIMIFETCNGKCFNSISLEHLKNRFGLSHSEYSICVQYAGKLFVHAGYDTLEECKLKAEIFVKRYRTDVLIYYFERPTADEWCQELIEEVHCISKGRIDAIKQPQTEARKNETDKSIEDSTKKYLEFLKNSY